MIQTIHLGYSVKGIPINLYSLGNGNKKVLIVGGVHGQPERQSVDFCILLLEEFRMSTVGPHCRLLVLPELNPDSNNADGVQTNANGIDLNRNFPSTNQHLADKFGKNKGGNPLSEPESRIMYDLVHQEEPDLIIAIHQKYMCLDYDGPEDTDLLKDLEKVFELPVRKLGACPGSMGSYFGEELGIPVITVEFEYDCARINSVAAAFAQYLRNEV